MDKNELAKKLSIIINSLSEDLACSICQQGMKNCRRVTCGHWFCQQCIEEVIKNRPPGERSGSCPSCGHSINKRSLKEDELMQSVIEKVSAAKKLLDENGLGQSVENSLSESSSSASSSSTDSLSDTSASGHANAAAGIALDGAPETPDVSFELLTSAGLDELSASRSGDKALVTHSTLRPDVPTPTSSRGSADLSVSRISRASDLSRKKLFQEPEGLSDSSSGEEGASGGTEKSLESGRAASVCLSPSGQPHGLRDSSINYSKQSSHMSQFFDHWPYHKTQEEKTVSRATQTSQRFSIDNCSQTIESLQLHTFMHSVVKTALQESLTDAMCLKQ